MSGAVRPVRARFIPCGTGTITALSRNGHVGFQEHGYSHTIDSAMSKPWKLAVSGIVLSLPLLVFAQTRIGNIKKGASTLQQYYNSAQRSQQSGNLEEAGRQYRAFLSEAQGQLAVGHSEAGDYLRAASLFDEALLLVPDSPLLRLAYAGAALKNGNLSRVETLSRAFFKDYPGDRKGLAQAHQYLGRAYLKMNRDLDAKKELETALALDASFANGYDLAVVCLTLDDEKCAVQIFSELERSFGDTPEIHMAFGRAYGDSDFVPRAVEEFKKAIAEAPRLPTAHYSLAAALLASGEDESKVQAAEQELKKELVLSPHDYLTHAALGKLALVHHQYPEAEKYLKQSIALNPKNPDVFLYLGQVYFETGRISDAETALRQSIQLTTDPSRNRYQIQKTHFLLGRILKQEHRDEEARAEMQLSRDLVNKVLSQDKSKLAGLLETSALAKSVESRAESGSEFALNSQSADPAAVRELDAFEKQLAPVIADSYNNLGVIAATSSHYADALRSFEQAAEWNPSLEGVDLNWGRAAFMASQFPEAIGPLSRYLRQHPADSGVRVALAMSLFMNRNYQGCIATLQGFEEKTASIPQMQYIYAESLLKTGQVSQGKERLEALEKTSPEIAEVHRGMGEAFEILKENEAALKELRRAIELNASDPEAHYLSGKIELESGNTAAAIPELESAIRLQSGDPRFHQELAEAYRQASRAPDAERELQIASKLQTLKDPEPHEALDPAK